MRCVSPVSPVSAAVSQTHYQDYKAETELRQRKEEMLGQVTPDLGPHSNDNGDKAGCDRLQAAAAAAVPDQRVK